MKSSLIIRIYFLLFLLSVFTFSVQAQIFVDTGAFVYRTSSGRVRSSQEVEVLNTMNIQRQGLDISTLQQMSRKLPQQSRRQIYLAKRKKAEKILAPNSQFFKQYESLLKQENTGIIRLLPEISCKEIYSVKKCPSSFIDGNGRSFSFRTKNFSMPGYADLEMVNGFLVSNGNDIQGIFVKLGDFALEEVLLTRQGINFLKDFVPSSDEEVIRKQYMQFWNEYDFENHRFTKLQPIELNTTYVLRTIAYQKEMLVRDLKPTLPEAIYNLIVKNKLENTIHNPYRFDKRDDVIIAFRVVEKNTDGSITIVWKQLQSKPAPFIGKRLSKN